MFNSRGVSYLLLTTMGKHAMKLFSNILVPVHTNRYTNLLIKEGLEMALHFNCVVHFLLVTEEKYFSKPFVPRHNNAGNTKAIFRQKIHEALTQYEQHPYLGQQLHVVTGMGNMEQCISRYAIRNHIDLVVLGKDHRPFWNKWFTDLSVGKLSQKLNCPILTLQSRLKLNKIRNIVMPVGTFLPVRKLAFATYLAKKYNSGLHLVALSGGYPQPDSTAENVYLLKAYRLILENTEVPVEYKTLPGENIASTTLQYAKKIKAGLIVINPGKESFLYGFLNRLFSRFLFNTSRIPVMTIAPGRNYEKVIVPAKSNIA